MLTYAQRVAELAEYGLTEYQGRVYLALVDNGPMKAGKLPSVSGVPRGRAYVTLDQLQVKGLVRILPERPLRFIAVPFDDFLRVTAADYRTRANYLESNAKALAREFVANKQPPAGELERFEAIHGRKNARERIRAMYEDASTEIIAIGSVGSPARIMHAYGPTLAEKSSAGVSVKYAFATPDNLESVRLLAQFAEIRALDFPFPVVLHGVDGRQFCMLHTHPDDDSVSRGDDVALWTDDPSIAQAMALIAKRVWETSRPLPKPVYSISGKRTGKAPPSAPPEEASG